MLNNFYLFISIGNIYIFNFNISFIFNYVFIYGIGSHKGFGFVGSPLATVAASWFQPVALFVLCVTWKKYHRGAWDGWAPATWTRDRICTFARIAVPIACNALASNLANSLVTLVAARMGPDVIAANAVVSGLWGLMWALFWGFGCATQARWVG